MSSHSMLSICTRYSKATTIDSRMTAESAYSQAMCAAIDETPRMLRQPAAAAGELPRLENIAPAARAVDQFRVEGIVDLAAQAPDRNIDHVGIAVEVHVPDLFGDLRS